MNNLFVFGCSFTQPFFDDLNAEGLEGTFSKYKKWRGGTFPKTWSELLAEKIGYNLVSYARGGACNYYTIREYNNHCHEIQENDIVIIQWTHVERFWTVMNTNELTNISGNWQFDSVQLDPKTVEEIYVNRSNKPWVEEIYSFERNIDNMARLGKHKVFYWSACDLIINSESEEFRSNPKYLLNECDESAIYYFDKRNENLRISAETNSAVADAHYGEIGHQFLSNKIYNQLKERNAI